tara:strand:- start:4145 stop:5497 length:1353 start_codon:yes stop_codon:yes gene_type:complete
MKWIICFLLAFSGSLAADTLAYAPPDFEKDGKTYRFVDFEKAYYSLDVNYSGRSVLVNSQVHFTLAKDGYVIFDSVPNLFDVYLNGKQVEIGDLYLPETYSPARYIQQKLKAGSYVMISKNYINDYVTYEDRRVRMAFWMSDLRDRNFLEQYMPSNFDYDQYQMDFHVSIQETDRPHVLMHNCAAIEETKFSMQLECPSHYNSSSLFFHLFEEGRFVEKLGSYPSIDGRSIPYRVYGETADRLFPRIDGLLKELEGDYGAWPYDSLLVYANTSSGGMEYAAATSTGARALGHELHHAYFARSAHPAGGNAGWVDEALASWRDGGYKVKTSLGPWHETEMASHSPYTRVTDMKAYTQGAQIIAHIDYLVQDVGGLKDFLKHFHAISAYLPFDTESFKLALEQYYEMDFAQLFDTYVYGKRILESEPNLQPMHLPEQKGMHDFTEEELYEIL